jgi:ABC-type antimicrobial peptide transport system permease subunit
VIVVTDTVAGSERVAARVADELSDAYLQANVAGGSDAQALQVLDWRDLMPQAEQMIEMKLIGAQLFFALIAIIVSFSIVNTFMMTVFERTPEFGMLMAIGMRPGKIMAQLSVEAAYLAVVGVALGIVVTLVIVVPLGLYGMPLPADATEMLNQFNMPDRMYPAFSVGAAITSSLIMLVGTQIAAFIPALRIHRMRPVDALRAME